MALLLRSWAVLMECAPPTPATVRTVEPDAEAFAPGGVREVVGDPEPSIRRRDDGRIGERATR